LPNQLALAPERERRLAPGEPAAALLYVDFDGMREANNVLGPTEGGDVLIRTVGQAIPSLLHDGELAARLHRAGDEFACLLHPGEDGRSRALALEDGLDRLVLPETHAPLYGGASVGWASSEPGDTPDALIARAAASMRERKQTRRGSASR
jgi:GGDEF domain-containing protein